jgi:hypothetical protein
MANTKQAGHYELREFTLLNKSLNVSRSMIGFVGSFNIFESMNNGAIQGSAVIFESYDILNSFPIRGQEFIRVVYIDFFGKEREEYYFVYAVTNISYGDEKNPSFMQYTLNFTSPYKLLSENFRVQRAYTESIAGTKLISDYVVDAFDEYYQKPVEELFGKKLKFLLAEKTSNERTLVVPKYSPAETMNFFTRNAYSDVNPLNDGMKPSQTFRFFEARDAFLFGTNEYMRYNSMSSSTVPGTIGRPIIEYKRNYAGSISAESQVSAMTEILDVNFGTRVNTIDSIVNGGYRRKIYEFNLLTMNIDERVFDYSEEENHDPDLNPIHDKLFIRSRMSKEKEYFIFRDWDGPGVTGGEDVRKNTHFDELYTVKPTHFYNHNTNTLDIVVYGRNDIFAGSTVNITLYKHAYQMTTEEEERLNGMYLVESVNSTFNGNVFKQQLRLTRGGINIA